MRLGVIGAGWLGGTVGSNWVRAGHAVLFSSRHPDRLDAIAKRLGPKARIGTLREAAAFGEVVLFSVPYESIPDLGRDLRNAIDGKIVLDACNQPFSHSHPLAVEAEAIGIGPLTRKYLPGARVVRCFSAVDATDIEASFSRETRKLAVPLAGDDAEAVETAAQLVHDAGCVPLVVGGLDRSKSFMRGTPPFRANTTLENLRRAFGMG